MVVHVNLLHTEGFSLEGSVPAKVVEYLQREFGSSNIVIESDEELVDPFDTDWFRESMDRQTDSGFQSEVLPQAKRYDTEKAC